MFARGKAAGLGEGTGTFTADRLVLIPAARVTKTTFYQALLRD